MDNIELALIHYDGDNSKPYCDLVYKALKEMQSREQGCMRCNHGKAYFTSTGARLFVGDDGSFTIDTGTVPFIDFPKNTMKYCPWCGRNLTKEDANER